MMAGKGSEIAQGRGGVEQLVLGQMGPPPFWPLIYGGFSMGKWGELGGQEAGGAGEGVTEGPRLLSFIPHPQGPGMEPRP